MAGRVNDLSVGCALEQFSDRICLGGHIIGQVAQKHIRVSKDAFSLHFVSPFWRGPG